MTSSSTPRLSFIIPARNEERFLGATLASIRDWCPPHLLAEIIVVDHGSVDATREIAGAAGAIVLRPDVRTIAALRNEGAKVAKGNVFVFLDADTTLTASWREEIGDVLDTVLRDPPTISGSNCDVPDSDNWFLRYWFKPIANEQSARTLGSAHMIVPRALFERLGGFDVNLATGEDPDLCERAMAIGAMVRARPSLRVIHHGYPTTVGAFVRRERWHGGGDTVTLGRMLRSRVVWVAGTVLALQLLAVLGLWYSWKISVAALIVMVALLYATVRMRFRGVRGVAAVPATMISYLYYLGRAMSFGGRRERGAR